MAVGPARQPLAGGVRRNLARRDTERSGSCQLGRYVERACGDYDLAVLGWQADTVSDDFLSSCWL
jgi:hypothetical protein